jgi:hypothetical protein
MSFFTSLQYYRPRPPPAMTADDLARFVTAIRDTGTLTASGLLCLKLKFGDSIDQDDKGTTWEEETAPYMAIIHDVDWDVELGDPSDLQEIVDRLTGDERRVYRAYVGLGAATDGVLKPITRTNSPENSCDFYPCDVAIGVGP